MAFLTFLTNLKTNHRKWEEHCNRKDQNECQEENECQWLEGRCRRKLYKGWGFLHSPTSLRRHANTKWKEGKNYHHWKEKPFGFRRAPISQGRQMIPAHISSSYSAQSNVEDQLIAAVIFDQKSLVLDTLINLVQHYANIGFIDRSRLEELQNLKRQKQGKRASSEHLENINRLVRNLKSHEYKNQRKQIVNELVNVLSGCVSSQNQK